MKVLQENESLLVFRVGPVACCAPVYDVEAIVTPPARLTAMPGQARCIAGIFHHRTETAYVVDVRCKFGLPARGDKGAGRLVMVRTPSGLAGFWVDEIVEVTASEQCQWAEPPRLIPQSVFEKTVLYKDELVLYTDFARLYAMADAGPFQTWVGQQQRQGADLPVEAANETVAMKEEKPPSAQPESLPVVPAGGEPERRVVPAAPTPTVDLDVTPGKTPGVPHAVEEKSQQAPVQPAVDNTAIKPREPPPGADVQSAQRTAGVRPVPHPDTASRIRQPAEPHTRRRAIIQPRDPEPQAVRATPTPAMKPERRISPPTPFVAEPSPPARVEKGADVTVEQARPVPPPKPERETQPPAAEPPPPWRVEKDADAMTAQVKPASVPKSLSNAPPRPTVASPPPSMEKSPAELAKPATVPSQREAVSRPVVIVDPLAEGSGNLPVVSGPASDPVEPFPEQFAPVAETPLPNVHGKGRRHSSLWLVGATVLIAASAAVVWYPAQQTPVTNAPKPPSPIVSHAAAPVVEPIEDPPASASNDASPVADTEPTAPEPQPEPVLAESVVSQSQPEALLVETAVPKPQPATAETVTPQSQPEPGQVLAFAEEPAPREVVSSTAETPAKEAETPASVVVHTPPPFGPYPLATHIVVDGDTLWHLARRYLHNPFRYPELARLSEIKNPDLIYPGDRVRYRGEGN